MTSLDHSGLLSELYSLAVRKAPLDNESLDITLARAVILEEIKTSCMQLKNKLLLMSVLKRLVMNSDSYKGFCEEFVNQGLFSYICGIIEKTDDLYMLYASREAMLTFLVSPVAENERKVYIRSLCHLWVKQDTAINTKVTVLEMFLHLFSRKSNHPCMPDLENDILRQLHSTWYQAVEDIVFKLKLHEDKLEFYMTRVFVKMWKKLIRKVNECVQLDQTLLVYVTSTQRVIHEMPTVLGSDNSLELIGVLDSVVCHGPGTIHELQKFIKELAYQVLSVDKLLFTRSMKASSSDGFLGCRNVENTTVQGRSKDLALILKLSIKSCHIVSDQTLSDEKETAIKTVCGCLETMSTTLQMPLYRAVVDCFVEQDDAYFSVNLSLLKIFVQHNNFLKDMDESSELRKDLEEICKLTNPHEGFLIFLQNTNWDFSLLMDFIISPETCFLEYFLLYLKVVICDWDLFVDGCQQFAITEKSVENQSPKSENSDESFVKLPNNMQNSTCLSNENNSNLEKCAEFSCEESGVLLSVLPQQAFTSGALVDYSDSSEEDSSTPISGDMSEYQKYEDETSLSRSHQATEHCEENLDKLVQSDEQCVTDCEGLPKDTLENFMSVLIRLKLKLERMQKRDLLAFNVTPLIQIISKCEAKYEE